MKIVLSGVETNNKGAELMLIAILQQIELVDKSAEVYIAAEMINHSLDYLHTNVTLYTIPVSRFSRIATRFHFTGLLNRLGLFSNILNNCCMIRNVDYFIDGSGLLFSDYRNIGKASLQYWDNMLKTYHKRGTKIVFLPQAFGPAERYETREIIKSIGKYSNLIYAREKTSESYLRQILGDNNRIRVSTDFTSLVKPDDDSALSMFKGKVCIIPNFQMINMKAVSKDIFYGFLRNVIELCKNEGFDPFLLNHEGVKDEELCIDFCNTTGTKIDLITGKNAIEVKAIISQSYLVISSRFHGVASALNSGVPCLSTSWGHKYEELFNDYDQRNCVLDLLDIESYTSRIKEVLDNQNNKIIREELQSLLPKIRCSADKMWKEIWALKLK